MVTVESPEDLEMTSAELEQEIATTEQLLEEIEDNRGMSTRNALGLFFWPSIVINEVTGTLAQNRASDRIEHLNALLLERQETILA